jgi:intracellular multiplication protein IcmG
MNDQDNKDEYQFTDVEGFNEEYNPEQTENIEINAPTNKNFILEFLEDEENKEILKKGGIALGVIIFIVMFYIIFISKKPKPEPVALPAVKTITAYPQRSAQTNIQETRMLNQLSGEQQTLMSKLDDANNQIINLQNQISNYQAAMSSLSASLEETKLLQQQQTQTIQTMANDITQMKLIQDSFVKRTTKNGYFIQAIVPGRAWLQGPDGNTVTVGVGSMIPGYGEVVDISTQDGAVKTRSGKIITVSQQDS